jgi:hypothetical protein
MDLLETLPRCRDRDPGGPLIELHSLHIGARSRVVTTLTAVADTFTTNNSLCPHCARRASLGHGPSREHIFSEALGGRQTIMACADCNSAVGSGVEGRLLSPNSAMTFFQQNSGLPHMDLAASSAQGDFRVDLPSGKHLARLRVTEVEIDGERTIQIFGSPSDARRVIDGFARKHGIPVEEINKKFESALSAPRPADMLKINVTLDLVLVRRLIAKTALCVLTYLQGDPFVTTDMAAWLRQVLDAPRHWGNGVAREGQDDPGGVGVVDGVDTEALFESFWSAYGDSGEPSIGATDEERCRLIMWPTRTPENAPITIFALSFFWWTIPTGVIVPGHPSDVFAAILFSEAFYGSPIVRDIAGGLPNGY